MVSLEIFLRFSRKLASITTNCAWVQLKIMVRVWLDDVESPILLIFTNITEIQWQILAAVRTCRTEHSAFTLACGIDTTRIIGSTHTLEHLEVAPFSDYPQKWFILILKQMSVQNARWTMFLPLMQWAQYYPWVWTMRHKTRRPISLIPMRADDTVWVHEMLLWTLDVKSLPETMQTKAVVWIDFAHVHNCKNWAKLSGYQWCQWWWRCHQNSAWDCNMDDLGYGQAAHTAQELSEILFRRIFHSTSANVSDLVYDNEWNGLTLRTCNGWRACVSRTHLLQ